LDKNMALVKCSRYVSEYKENGKGSSTI